MNRLRTGKAVAVLFFSLLWLSFLLVPLLFSFICYPDRKKNEGEQMEDSSSSGRPVPSLAIA